MDTIKLYEILDRRFSLNDLHGLAWDCGWTAENIGTNHTIKPTFLRELIQYASRHSALNKLMQMAANHNPVLSFNGTVLREKGGDSFEPSKIKQAEPVDPRIAKKQELIEALNRRSKESIFDALIYLLETAP